ncbi:MAG: DMT family transporter [Paracoccaceae bacterium]
MTQHPDRILPGVALMLGFCVIAPLIDVSSKLAAQGVPVGTITLGRFVVQALLMLPVTLVMGFPLALSGRALWLSLARAFVSILSTYAFIAALRVMPLADALSIAFVEPFIILLIARLVLKEPVGARRLGACVVGFLGCLLVIQPSFVHFGPVALFPLGTALCFALYILITRALSRLVHPVPMQFHTAIIAALMCLPMLLAGQALGETSLALVWPQGLFLLWCFCVGLAATVSHMSMTFALRFAPSSVLAPLHYLEIVTAALLGYLVFGDFPNGLTWTGIAIIVSSGLYIIHRERITARRATASAGLTEAP